MAEPARRGEAGLAAAGGLAWALFARFLAILVALNFAWEVAQLPLYAIWQKGSWGQIGFAIAHCTGGDLLIATVCTIVSAAFTGWRWPRAGRQRTIFMSVFVLLGAGYTIFSEWLNVSVRGNWAYSDWMPVLPLLGTGISPLLQWILLPIAAFRIADPKLREQSHGRN